LELLVGTGGWAYLPTGSGDRLRAYAELFSFVEVNSTFYRYPRLSTVRSWRRRVPRDFVFSVKCHRDATHVHGLRPVEGTFRSLERMFQVCRLLRSEMLVLQTPAAMTFTEEAVRDVGTMFRSLTPPGIRLVWEVRRPRGGSVPDELLTMMADLDITRAVDLTREDPPESGDLLYSRLFGWAGGSLTPFSDTEMATIYGRVSRSRARKAALVFHGARMYHDAGRFMEDRGSELGLREKYSDRMP